MTQYKTHQVVMLPTHKPTGLILIASKQGSKPELFYLPDEVNRVNWAKNISQHFYILSDKSIKEEDWCYLDGIISQARKNEIPFEDGSTLEQNGWKKIIATTDISIKTKINENKSLNSEKYLSSMIIDSLPQLSQVWIKYFIEQYNLGNIITEVEVEYKAYHGVKTAVAEISAVSGNNEHNWKGIGDNRDYKLIINPDNTINIKFSVEEKLYTRDEVNQLLINGMIFASSFNELTLDCKTWIKRKLNK